MKDNDQSEAKELTAVEMQRGVMFASRLRRMLCRLGLHDEECVEAYVSKSLGLRNGESKVCLDCGKKKNDIPEKKAYDERVKKRRDDRKGKALKIYEKQT